MKRCAESGSSFARRERERQEAERRRVENYKASREQLLALIDNWGVASRIAAFLSEAEAQVANAASEQYRLAYVREPEGIIVGLAEERGGGS